MTRTMGDLQETRLGSSESDFFKSFAEKDPFYLARRVQDRVQLLAVPCHFRWPVLI
jgi:hypothetical protein